MVAVMDALSARIDAGSWGHLADPAALDARAQALGTSANQVADASGTNLAPSPPAFVAHDQAPLPRLAFGVGER
jgi:hypothetical protein